MYFDSLRDDLVIWADLYHKIIWLMMALAWGTLRLTYLRTGVSAMNDDTSEENLWDFGQFLAIILSTFPLWSIYTSIQGVFMFFPSGDILLMPYDRNQVRGIKESRS